MAELNLSDADEMQLQSYLKFAKLKRDQHVRETTSVIKEFQASHLHPGEMYNHQEAKSLFQELQEEVRALVDKEIQHAYHTSGLLIKLLITQAESNGHRLQVDTSSLENEALLRQVAKSELAALGRTNADFARSAAEAIAAARAPAPQPTLDPQQARELQQLRGEKAALQERLAQLQEQFTGIMRERTAQNSKISSLEEQLAAATSSSRAAESGNASALTRLQSEFAALSVQAEDAAHLAKVHSEGMEKKLNESHGKLSQAQRELTECREELRVMDEQLHAARDALDVKLQDSKQFQQLRALMQAKSGEVVDLRRRLAKYEPQGQIPSADD